MELPNDLLILINHYVKDIKDIFSLRLTNKIFYNLNKVIPFYENNTKIFEIYFKHNKITWIQCYSKKKLKEIIFKPYGGIEVNNYNVIYNDSKKNNDYKFNLPYDFTIIRKNKNFRIKQTYDIINNNNKTEMIPVYFLGCQLS